MPLTLSTDTRATRLETIQYELLGKRLGTGIPRRTLIVAAATTVPWLVLMLLVGVPLLSSLGPATYLVPPFLVTYRGLRRDPSGRISLIRWYDRLLAHRRSRRCPVRNPWLSTPLFRTRPATVTSAATVLVPGGVS
jgi:hypothetical protein